MDSNTIAMIATTLLAVLGFVGVITVALKYVSVAKEFGDVITAIAGALQDAKVTTEEIDMIKLQLQEFKDAVSNTKSAKEE